ncbi:ABC transporter permease [Actinomadura sp. KC06]|uniref:FtsX-like permease family protein n=1 Tax=Actinomadura sp. KC06 TaxID=2530369 RepID=UPI0010453C45|nr:FtsX-like permease family protein [Actinomadura sp. KC06]TDD32969.1 ABC transporter permease [Actinomadura sp. KC06]
MLRIALLTVRARWIAFAGSFLTLTLGVALVATMGLALAAAYGTETASSAEEGSVRYGAAPAVVRAPDSVRVAVGDETESRELEAPRGLDPAVAAKAAALGGAVEDRVFYAQPASRDAGGPRVTIGRPWSVAPYAPYRLVAGRAPAAPDEVASPVGGPRPGAAVPVLTARGPAVYRVVGVVDPGEAEPAILFTDAAAARLSPRVDAVISRAPAAELRAAVDGSAVVLTGDRARTAGAGLGGGGKSTEQDTLDGTKIMLGTAGGICGFVAVFVVASTFSLAVAQRRRELALLRAVGATPRQVRRMLFAEAFVVGVIAAALGCALGPVCAPALGGWLVDRELAPASYTVPATAWPLAVAFAMGLTVSLLGVWAASRRAGRIRPAEALRDAALETKAMTAGRWVLGAGGTVAGLWMLASVLGDPGGATSRKQYIPVTMLLIAGFAMLAPIIVPPLARLVTLPLRLLRGAGAMIVRENALTAARRTASTAAPVLVTVGLGLSLLGATASIDGAEQAELRDQHRADFIVTPAGTPGLNQAVVDRVEAVPGVDTVVRTPTVLFALEDGEALVKYPAQAVTPRALGEVAELPLVSGDPARLADDSIIVSREWGREPGERIDVWLADGTRTSLTVAAVLETGTGDHSVFVTPRNAGTAMPESIDVKLRPGTDAAAALAALRAATDRLGARPAAVPDWIGAAASDSGRQSRLGMYVVLGVALLYCAIAIANTLVMATADRARDQAVLRLSGATRRQVLGVVAAESLLVVGVGAVLALLVSALSMGGVVAGLLGLSGRLTVVVPWSPVGGIVAACVVIALLASVLPARAAMRTRATEALGTNE